jgi:hypothetical protein
MLNEEMRESDLAYKKYKIVTSLQVYPQATSSISE